MAKLMKLGLIGLEEEEKWQNDERTTFGVGPNAEWLVYYQVWLYDKLEEREKKPILDLPYLGLLVCSQRFRDTPPDNYMGRNAVRALVQDKFSEIEAKNYLEKKLDRIDEGTADQLTEVLRGFLVIGER